jgi:hypothetical protein
MNELKLRGEIVSEMEWWVNHQSLTTYDEDRPIPLEEIKQRKANRTDCSGIIIGVFYSVGSPVDPSGNHFDGEGNTTSFIETCHHITQATLQPGDIIEFGGTADLAHAALVTHVDGAEILLASNGENAGPITISLEQEITERRAGGFPVKPIYYLSAFAPQVIPKAKRFVVYKDGKVVDHTNHWKTWVIQHRPFRNGVSDVRFHDRNAKGG